MTTQVEYALMAGASYISTRASVNKFPTPNNWTKITAPDFYSRDPYSGFEAISFTNGSEIVISYAGTDPGDLAGDVAADLALAAGYLSNQLRQAADHSVIRAADAHRASTPLASEQFRLCKPPFHTNGC